MTEEESQGNRTRTLVEALEIFGTENLPKNNDSDLQVCLRSLERIAREKGLDYLREHRQLIIDRVEIMCNQQNMTNYPTYIPPSKR